MQSGGTYLQGYNCQLAMDADYQVIVAVGVSNQPSEVEHLESMLEHIATSAGASPAVMTIDAGLWRENNAKFCADQGIDALVATGWLPQSPQTQKQEGIQNLCPTLAEGFSVAVGDCGAGERADYGSSRPVPLLAEGIGEGEWRVAPDRFYA